jgi:putative DNA primase/helicase
LKPGNDDELIEIRAGLTAGVEALCEMLLGKPTSRMGGEWRWNRKGSFKVNVRGAHKGRWHDFETGERGDMLALIQRERGGDFPATLEWARGFLGMGDAPRPVAVLRTKGVATDDTPDAEDAAKADRARRYWNEGGSVSGTVAERYLVAARCIAKPPAGWPPALRFHPGRRALMVAATTADGTVQAVQMIHLTAEGQKVPGEPGRPTKQSFGPQAGAVVRLPGAGGPLLVAEGPETGLSAWIATGQEAWISLGSMAKVDLPPLRQVVLCADDDKRDAPATKALRRAIGRWRSEAREIGVARPWSPRRYDGSDLNDVLREAGAAAVAARIAIALAPQGPQPPGNKALPVALARHQLGQKVAAFFKQAAEYDPDTQDGVDNADPIVWGVKVGVGLGKSYSARKEAAKLLADMRARGDDRTIIMAVPTHKLGAEQAAAFDLLPEAREAGLRAAVWRGREAADPETPGKAMCHDLDAVREVQGLGVNVEASVCRRKPKGQEPILCPFHAVCGYQRQKIRADFWLVPHEILFGEKPKALGTPAAVIVDESVFRKGLEGVDGLPMELTLDALDDSVTLPAGYKGTSTPRLQHVHRITAAALATLPDGPLHRADLLAAGLTAETGKDGSALSWLRVVDPGLMPGMGKEQRRELLRSIGQNKTAIRLARFFKALAVLLDEGGPEASGWVSLATKETKEGPQRVIRLRGRRKVREGWQAPTLLLDALLAPDLLRHYWPALEVVAEIEAQTPHVRVRQLDGRDWVKSALVPDDRQAAKENERRLKNSERLRAAVWREARQANGRVLVVAQKAVREYWESLGMVPANVSMAHHNAVAGLDNWGDVDRLVVVGRTLPNARDVERIAEALTGAAVATPIIRWERRDAAVQLADGTALAGEADFHPDPVAEAIRWQICEGELIQIVGRGRAVNRTAETPLDVLVMTDRPIPLEIHEAVTWEALMPSPFDVMMAQGGVALLSPTDAANCYPHIWTTPAAAKMAFTRHRVTNPYKEYPLMGNVTHCLRVAYQKAGERQRPAEAIFDPALVDDLHGWLEDRVGELAWLRVIQPEPEPPRPGRSAQNSGWQRPESPVSPQFQPGRTDLPGGGSAAEQGFSDQYARAREGEVPLPGEMDGLSERYARTRAREEGDFRNSTRAHAREGSAPSAPASAVHPPPAWFSKPPPADLYEIDRMGAEQVRMLTNVDIESPCEPPDLTVDNASYQPRSVDG